MARKPRVHYPGAYYHVILRGNGGLDVFFDRQERSKFFFLLQEGIKKYHHRLHGYCLMTNQMTCIAEVNN